MAYAHEIQTVKTIGSGGESSGNSSTTALADAASYTGTWTDVSSYDSVTVAVKTDQNGYFSVQFSPDGTNIDSTLTRYYRTDLIEAPHRFTITRKYCRVTFTNDSGSAQTYFRLQTMFGNKGDLNAPADSTLAPDFDSIAVRPSDYKYEVALSLRQGAIAWNKWGYNSDIDNGGIETIWSPGGNCTFQTSSNTCNVVSTSTNDADGEIGAHGIVLYGIDENRRAQTEVVMLDGSNNVTTTGSFLGINRAALFRAGTSMYNEGTITIKTEQDQSIQAEIPLQEGSTQQALFFTQDGHKTLMDWLIINVTKAVGQGQAPIVTIKGWVQSFVSNAKYEVFRSIVNTSVENTIELKPSQPFVVDEKSVLWFTAESDQDNTVVSIRFSCIEVRNKDAATV